MDPAPSPSPPARGRPSPRWVLAAAALLAACTAGEFRPAPDAPRYPPHRGEVRVLPELPPASAYERLGVVWATGGEFTREGSLRERVLAEAARRGADTVVFQGPVLSRPYQDGHEQKKLAAWALRSRR